MSHFEFTMEHVDEEHAPPIYPVLNVAVIGGVICLELANKTETNNSRTLTEIARTSVDLEDFQALLTAAVNANKRPA